jgi:hypothetical protein
VQPLYGYSFNGLDSRIAMKAPIGISTMFWAKQSEAKDLVFTNGPIIAFSSEHQGS